MIQYKVNLILSLCFDPQNTENMENLLLQNINRLRVQLDGTIFLYHCKGIYQFYRQIGVHKYSAALA